MRRRLSHSRRPQVERLEDRLCPALHILFDYRFQAIDPGARNTLENVVRPHLEAGLQNNTLAAQHVPPTFLTGASGGLIDPTTNQVVTPDKAAQVGLDKGLDVPADTIVVFVGFNNQLGGDGGQGYGRSMVDESSAPTVSRGIVGAAGPNATHVAPGYGTIEFDSTRAWNYAANEGDPIPNPKMDFNNFSETAGHELGHVLGFGDFNAAPAWTNQVLAAKGGFSFKGEHAKRAYNQKDAGGHLLPVPLTSFDQGGHWGDHLAKWSSTDGNFATMQENGAPHKRTEIFSALDFAALADIGWVVS
jgi:hypothetical protein